MLSRQAAILLICFAWGTLYTPEEFENGGFTPKTHQMFSVHTTPEEFKDATITDHFGFVFEENSVREITWLSWRHRFRKAPFSKCFPSTRKRNAGVLNFLRFEESFRRVPFSWRINVDGGPNRENKAVLTWMWYSEYCLRKDWKVSVSGSNHHMS